MTPARFWRPMHEPKRSRPWYLASGLDAIHMSPLAAKLIYRHVNIVPIAKPYANDGDHVTW